MLFILLSYVFFYFYYMFLILYFLYFFFFFFFFFQAEDGIRDVAVTGVQTCALPIWLQLDHDAKELIRKSVQAHEKGKQKDAKGRSKGLEDFAPEKGKGLIDRKSVV